jgi:acyl carrier protein
MTARPLLIFKLPSSFEAIPGRGADSHQGCTMNTPNSTRGSELDARLQRLIAEMLDLAAGEVRPEMRREDTGAWDSMAHFRLVTAVESAFAVRLTMEEIAAIGSPMELQRIVLSHGGLT